MQTAIDILIALIAFLHLYFLWFEMFAWETVGRKVFKDFPKELFGQTKSMAANQGLYNGFLSAGLIWSLLINDQHWSQKIALFFLVCVAIAGLYGALTVSKKILFVQAVPAFICVVLLLVGFNDF